MWGLPGLDFPTAWRCFSPGHHCLLPSVLAMSRLAWCPGHSLRGGMTQQETFPKQGCVESLTACGLGHISRLGAPLALFLFKQERQLLSSVCPIDMAAGLTSASSCVHGVSCGYASLAAPKAAVGLSSPQTSEPCLRIWHLTEETPERTRPVLFQRLSWSQLQGQHREGATSFFVPASIA